MAPKTPFEDICDDHNKIPTEVMDFPTIPLDYEDIDKESLLGMGGSAQVYRASVDAAEIDTIAIKEPRFDVSDGQLSEMFANEAELWSYLDHEYIMSVVDWGTDPHPWIALEYAEGGTLADHIRQQNLEHSLWLSICIAKGVKYAHRQGVVHLDLKPENILLQKTATNKWDIPKVTDWGLAKLLLKYTGEIEGLSFHYAAPEQCRPEEYQGADEKTDVYQLGGVIYALLTGRPPVTGSRQEMVDQTLAGEIDPPSSINPSLPEFLDVAIMQALETKPENRYEDVILIRQALEQAFLDVHAIKNSPQPRVNARRTGEIGAGGPTTAVGVNWKVNGEFVPAGPPAIVDDNVYLTTKQGTVHVFSVHSGAVQWGAKLSDKPLTAPVIDDSRLYTADQQGEVYRITPNKERQTWQIKAARSIRAAPLLLNDMAILVDIDGTVFALSFPDTVAWQSQAPGKVRAPPAIRGEQLFLASSNGLASLNTETGACEWEYTNEDSFRSAPAVVGQTIFAAGRDVVVAIDTINGKKRWAFDLNDRATGVAATSSECYVSTVGGELFAIDTSTGTETWRYTQQNVELTAPIIGEQTVFVGGSAPGTKTLPVRMDDVHAVNAKNGRNRWTYATDNEVQQEPIITGDSLLVADTAGTLYSLR